VKRVLAAIVLLAVAGAAAYGYDASRRERDYRRLIDQGEAALARDDTAGAGEAFRRAIDLKPTSMLGHLKRGETYRRRGDLEAALLELRRATELDPLAPRPLELLGDVDYAMGRLRQGDAVQANGRFKRSAERYQAYVRLDDRSPRVLYKLGLAHQAAGQPAAGIEALRKAVAFDDRFPEAHYLLGVCLRDLNKLTEALDAFERSRALAPAMIATREALAALYGQLGRGRDRVDELHALQALDPAAFRAVALGLAYHQAGDTNRAVLVLSDAADRYPDHSDTYVALGRVWLESAQASGDRVFLGKALEALDGAVGSEDGSEALTLFGRALMMAGDDELAERMLQQATEKFPVDPLAFFYYADVTERRANPDAARRALLDYQALAGGSFDSRRRGVIAVRVADLSMRASDTTAAVAWFQRAVAANAADAPVLVRMAEAQAKAGDRDGALATLARALEKDPANRAAVILQRRLHLQEE
jgi:tetratricopeptide (TPR) repeat protein